MKPARAFASVVAFVLLAAAVPGPARAEQGLNAAWNHCFGELGAAQNATFACNMNSGSHAIVAGFVLGSPMPIVIGWEAILDLASASPALPEWWQFKNIGTCRQTSLAIVFVANAADLCVDWSAALSVGGLGGYCTSTANCGVPGQPANTARIKAIAAVAPLDAQNLVANQEYFAFTLLINHTKTVGSGACGGCDAPVCIVFNSLNVVARDNVEHRFLTAPTAPGANFVTWQGGGLPVVGGIGGCPAATATRRSTWGSVKSMYR